MDISKIKSYVINLQKNKEKYDRILKNMNELNIIPERFDAIYGKDLDEEYINKITNPYVNYTLNTERNMDSDIGTLGGIGCYLSHLELWKLLLDSDKDIFLILEDDAKQINQSLKDINDFINNVNNICPDWDLIYLGYSKPYPNYNLDIQINDNIYKIKEITFQTHAYLINRKGALKLLEKSIPIVHQVDSYISFMAISDNFNAYRGKTNYIVQRNNEGTEIQTDYSKIKLFINRLKDKTIKIILILIILIVLIIILIVFNKK